MKRWLNCGVGLLMAWTVTTAQAQDPSNAPYARLGRPVVSSELRDTGCVQTETAAPAAALGRPRSAFQPAAESLEPAAYDAPSAPAAGSVFRFQAADSDGPSPFAPPDDGPMLRVPQPSNGRSSEERYLSGEPERGPSYSPSVRRSNYTARSDTFPIFGDGGGSGSGDQPARRWFESDRCFEYMISPITNPFLFEDPRSVTEVRPIFMYQRIPSSNPVFRGGSAEYFGTQLRLAFTDRFSFVMNELGGVSLNPGSEAMVPGGTGFAELRFGPKFTFLRNVESKWIGAMGLTFDLPEGSGGAYQNVGSLTLTPYVSMAKNFFETSWGSVNVMDTLGFSFATDSKRTNYFFNSIHFDYDILNKHQWFPLIELNWFNYTRSGTVNPFGTEGADLFNLGSMGVSGKNNLNLALGLRYKFNERVQVGAAVEFPLLDRRDMDNFRLTIDFIWRY